MKKVNKIIYTIILLPIIISCSEKKYDIEKIGLEFSTIDAATEHVIKTQKECFDIFSRALDTLKENRAAIIDTAQFRLLIDKSISETMWSITLIQNTESEDKEVGFKDKALAYETLSRQIQEHEFKECIMLLAESNADRYYKLAHKLKPTLNKLTLAEDEFNNAVKLMVSKYGIQEVNMK